MRNYVIIHGSYSNSQGHWMAWLEKKLKEAGEEVYNLDYPTYPNPVEAATVQNYDAWAKVLDTIKDKLNPETIFVGHSISNTFFVKYCLENNINVNKAIFVSGFTNYNNGYTDFVQGFVDQVGYDFFNKTMSSFYAKNPEEFRTHAKLRICFYSNNDPIVSQKALKDFAKIMDAETIQVVGAGHFCDGRFDESFEELLPLLDCQNLEKSL